MDAFIIIGLTFMVSSMEYVTGGIITLLVLGYLIYVLIKPEKF
jgi:K+-transporting ATPase KdpF subunit